MLSFYIKSKRGNQLYLILLQQWHKMSRKTSTYIELHYWLFIKKNNLKKLNHFIQKYITTSDQTIPLGI